MEMHSLEHDSKAREGSIQKKEKSRREIKGNRSRNVINQALSDRCCNYLRRKAVLERLA